MFKIFYVLFLASTIQIDTSPDMSRLPYNYYEIKFPNNYHNTNIYESTIGLSNLYTNQYADRGYRYICYYYNSRMYVTIFPRSIFLYNDEEIINIKDTVKSRLLIKVYHRYTINKRYLIKTYAFIMSGQLVFAKENLNNIKFLYQYLKHTKDNADIVICAEELKYSYDFLKTSYDKQLRQQIKLQTGLKKYDNMAR